MANNNNKAAIYRLHVFLFKRHLVLVTSGGSNGFFQLAEGENLIYDDK